MEKMTLDEQKQVMLDILTYIDQLAEKYHLTYSLWGGTMLGAVRHRGFIPWDDDIDISLPREDYEKLMLILKNQNKYTLYDSSIQPDYTWGWAKLTHRASIDKKKKYFGRGHCHGVFVDIIPIDGFPSQEQEIRKFKRKLHHLNLVIKSSHFSTYASSIELTKSIQKLFLLFPVFLYSKIKGGKLVFVKKLNQQSRMLDLNATGRCGHLLSRYADNLGYPSSIWREVREYEFEGHYFKGIADSHTYLSLLYGNDYMEIPPKEKQSVHEEHEFYRLEGVKDEYCDDHGQWNRAENGAEHTKTIY